MATKQIIEIDVTWAGYSQLRLNHLLNYLANLDKMEIKRITVRNKAK